jgi:hypothetical protein
MSSPRRVRPVADREQRSENRDQRLEKSSSKRPTLNVERRTSIMAGPVVLVNKRAYYGESVNVPATIWSNSSANRCDTCAAGTKVQGRARGVKVG